MDDSFASYRHAINERSESESSDVIDLSNDSSYLSSKRSSAREDERQTIIPDSDEGSDGSDTESSSLSFNPKKKGAKNKILTDSDLEDTSDCEDDHNMTMSAATRLSIFGVKAPGANSDDDFIESDSEEVKESTSPEESIDDLAPNPHIGHYQMPSRISSSLNYLEEADLRNDLAEVPDDVKAETSSVYSEKDFSIKILPSDEEAVIDVSSDDDIKVLDKEKTSVRNTSQISNTSQPKIANFFTDKTYPNSGVVYVKKQIKDNEMNKLNSLKVDLIKVNYLLESMNIATLPDKGVKLKRRADELKVEIRKQQEKVSDMVVEPDVITETHIKNDGFISWDDIKSGSTAVKPTKFGSQAISTHMAQRNLTLESLRTLHSSLQTCPSEGTLATPPKTLKTELMVHQLHALAWLAWRETKKPKGGILADDMGLGKTLTMISLILHSKENENDELYGSEEEDKDMKGKLANGGTLVVCPASLLNQWHGEITKHCKKNVLKVEVHHGLKREGNAYRLARNDVVITTYNLVQRDLERKGCLMRIHWQRVILDEAHTVRNHKSQTALAVCQLRAFCRWCLTGTPVHNKDLDLFALLKFLKCEPFHDIALWKKWIDNKSTGGQERLSMIMKTILLRRTKQQLQEQKTLLCLPEKTLHHINVKLSKEEMNVYQKVLVFSKTLFAQFLHQRAEKQNAVTGFNPKDYDPNGEYNRMHRKMVSLHGAKPVKSHEILVLLLRLRQICCHAGLIHSMLEEELYEEHEGAPEGPEVDLLRELASLNIEEEDEEALVRSGADVEKTSVAVAMSKVLKASNPVFDFKNKSAKIKSVLECLEEKVFIHKRDKSVVVSQWTSMLDIVETNLRAMGIKCATLSGKVPVTARHDIVKNFNDPNSPIQVLLLSLCAGGVGLNLIGGNHLLLLDLHWNPQLEAQAQDRIYRVGQSKPVHIYKFMCVETVEQSIKLIQDKKLELAENALTGAVMTQSSKPSIEDLKFMFNMAS